MDKLPRLVKRALYLYKKYDSMETVTGEQFDTLLLAQEVLEFAETIMGESYILKEAK